MERVKYREGGKREKRKYERVALEREEKREKEGEREREAFSAVDPVKEAPLLPEFYPLHHRPRETAVYYPCPPPPTDAGYVIHHRCRPLAPYRSTAGSLRVDRARAKIDTRTLTSEPRFSPALPPAETALGSSRSRTRKRAVIKTTYSGTYTYSV